MNIQAQQGKTSLKNIRCQRFQTKEIFFSLLFVFSMFALIHLLIQVYQGKNKLQIFYVHQTNNFSNSIADNREKATAVEFCLNNDQLVLDDVSEMKNKDGAFVRNFFPDYDLLIHGKKELGFDVNVLPPKRHSIPDFTISKNKLTVKNSSIQEVVIDFSLIPMQKTWNLFQDKPMEPSLLLKYPLWRDDLGFFEVGKSFKHLQSKYDSNVSGPTVLYVSSYSFQGRRFPRVILVHSGGNFSYDNDARLALEKFLLIPDTNIHNRFFKDNGTIVRVYWNNNPRQGTMELPLLADPLFFSEGESGK